MKRWLYVLWLAGMLCWHQSGAASTAASPATSAQWQIAGSDDASSFADFTSPSAVDLEDQSFAKRPAAPAAYACIEYQSGREAPGQLVVGAVGGDAVREISAVIVGRQPIRGPPVAA